MAPLYDGHDYYKRMFELQEKLRKSEEERIRLEERFNVLVRESHNRHDACMNRLRSKYIQYLEEQRTRDERNHKLLATLDKVTNKLALISAKKDRLNVLRKQYEAYLIRVYANRRPPGSVTGDSGIASQNEDKCSRKTVTARPDLTSNATNKNVLSPRVHQPPLQSSQPRSTSAPKFHDQSLVDNTSLNNPAILPTTSSDAPLDYHQTSILRTPHVYVSPTGHSADQLVQVPAIPASAIRQYSRTTFNYDENAPGNLRDASNFGVSAYATAPILSMTPSDQNQPNAVLDNRFFRQHVETVQATPGLSTTTRGFPEDVSRNEIARSRVPQTLDPSIFAQPFQHYDANMLLTDQRPQMREYVSADVKVAPLTQTAGKSDAYSTGVGALPGYMDYTMASPQKSEDEGSIRSLTSDDVDYLIRRNEHLRRNADAVKMPRQPSTALNANNVNADENDGRTTAILENELDRYISNIRRLHREHDVPSQEELDYEQNTSGDLLNVTLSEDALQLPVERKMRKEKVPKEMDRILALANDLVSRTADPMEMTHPVEQNDDDDDDDDDTDAEIRDEIRVRTQSDASESEGRRALADEAKGHGAAALAARDENRENIAKGQTELEQLRRKDAAITRESWNNDDSAKSRERDREVRSLQKEEITTASPNNISSIDNQEKTEAEQLNFVTGKESNVGSLFDTAAELAPWDLASVQKRVRQLCLDDDQPMEKEAEEAANNEPGEEAASESPRLRVAERESVDGKAQDSNVSQDTLPPSETKVSNGNEVASREENKTRAHTKTPEPAEISNGDRDREESKTDEPAVVVAQPQASEDVNELNKSESEKGKNGDVTSEMPVEDRPEAPEQSNEYSIEQGYAEDPNQVQQYEQDPNEQYEQYNQNISYDGTGEAYEGYAENQEYVQEENQQYVEYSENLAWGGVGEEMNMINPDRQYQNDDPNAQYEGEARDDPNEQDPNRAYDYSYDQQYDPNQGYEGDPNQTYEYTESNAYAADQTYDGAYEQEYKEQQNPDENAANVDSGREEISPVAEGASLQEQADSQPEREADESKDQPQQQADDVNGKSQSKKKDVIKSLLDSDTDTTIERNVSNTESDFDFN